MKSTPKPTSRHSLSPIPCPLALYTRPPSSPAHQLWCDTSCDPYARIPPDFQESKGRKRLASLIARPPGTNRNVSLLNPMAAIFQAQIRCPRCRVEIARKQESAGKQARIWLIVSTELGKTKFRLFQSLSKGQACTTFFFKLYKFCRREWLDKRDGLHSSSKEIWPCNSNSHSRATSREIASGTPGSTYLHGPLTSPPSLRHRSKHRFHPDSDLV